MAPGRPTDAARRRPASSFGLGPVIAALAILVAALAILLVAPRTGGGLAGNTWQWTGTTGQGAAPVVVPDPAAYTVAFGPQRTYRAVTDCAEVSGTYRVIPVGRVSPVPGLLLTPAPGAPPGCEAGSLSSMFLADLAQAASYGVVGEQLTITLADGRVMTFR